MTITRCLIPIGVLVAASACAGHTPAATQSDPSSSVEASGSFSLPPRDTVWMEVFVPAGVRTVRGVIAFIDRELDRYAYDDRDWRDMCARAKCALLRVGLPRQDALPPASQFIRNAALGGDAALMQALRLAGERTRHPELAEAGVLFFGFSASGSFGATFAATHADRTIGFIRYHSHGRGLVLDTAVLAGVPALNIAGGRDETAGLDDAKALWRAMRARGAPWAYVTHVAQPHWSIDGLVEAGPLMRDWAEAVLEARVGSGESKRLASVTTMSGWLVDDSTGTVTPADAFKGPASRASWVPTETSALGLRVLAGLCASVGLRTATALLGPGTRLDADEPTVCHYATAEPRRDLWLGANRFLTPDAARARLTRSRQAAGGQPLVGIGSDGFVVADSQRGCSTASVVRSAWTFNASLCGAGFGVATDSVRLRPLVAALAGAP